MTEATFTVRHDSSPSWKNSRISVALSKWTVRLFCFTASVATHMGTKPWPTDSTFSCRRFVPPTRPRPWENGGARSLGGKLSSRAAGPRDRAKPIPSASAGREYIQYYHENRIHDAVREETPTCRGCRTKAQRECQGGGCTARVWPALSLSVANFPPEVELSQVAARLPPVLLCLSLWSQAHGSQDPTAPVRNPLEALANRQRARA